MEGARAGAEGVGAGEARTGALSEWVMGYPDVGGIG